MIKSPNMMFHVYRRISIIDRTSSINRTPYFVSQIGNIFNLKSAMEVSSINRSVYMIDALVAK